MSSLYSFATHLLANYLCSKHFCFIQSILVFYSRFGIFLDVEMRMLKKKIFL